MIGDSLDTSTDVLRFCSVCNSWRSSISRFHPISLPLPLKFPCPFGTRRDCFLSETTIYRIKPPPNDDNSNLSKSYLVKVEETKPGRHPHWIRQINNNNNNFPFHFPQVLSLLDFPMVKLGKSNGLNYLIFNSSMIAKYGDHNPTLDDDRITDYNDMIVNKGRPYVVDKWGIVSWIHFPSLKLIQFSPPLFCSGGRKHLVESCGELYVVDRDFDNSEQKIVKDQAQQGPNQRRRVRLRCGPPRLRRINTEIKGDIARGKTVLCKVYKVDETLGKWVEVTNLGDQAFILSDDISFSVSVSEFDVCKGNCIYFKDRHDSNLFSYSQDGCIFNLVDGSIDKYRWSWPLCFSNLHLINTKLWILDCSNPPIMESVIANCQL